MDDGTRRTEARRLIAVSLAVFAVAAALRCAFVDEVLRQHEPPASQGRAALHTGFLTPDSAGYLRPAERLADGRLLEAGSITRPPGYPVFLWLCGTSPARVLPAQAALGALISVCTVLLSHHLLRSIPFSAAAGLLSASSVTGVGITGLIMADLLLAALLAAGLLALVRGSARATSGWVVSAGLLFGIAGLVKPILVLWPLLCVPVWYLLRRANGRRIAWTHLLLLVGLPYLFHLAWASCNYLRDGVFTFSDAGVQTTRLYWAVAVEERVRAGGSPSHESIRRNRDAVRARLDHLPPAERIAAYAEESVRILRAHPAQTATVFARNMDEATTWGWNHFPQQLPGDPQLLDRLRTAQKIEKLVRRHARWPLALGLVIMVAVTVRRDSDGHRRIGLLACGLALGYGYFVVASGVTFWTGPRVAYPVEAIAITIAVALVHESSQLIRARPRAE